MNLKTLYKISYGIYIISSKKGERINGQIVNTVFQTTAEPPTIAICVNKLNLTHEYIQDSRVFTISILSKDTPMKFIGHFGFKSGHNIDKFKDINYKLGITRAPIVLENVIGYLECEVINSVDVGTHEMFIGKLIAAEIISDGEPLTYAFYHEVKGGRAPKTATTFIKEDDKRG